MQDYKSAAAYLGTKTDRPLPGRATRIQRRDDHTIAIKYQATDVITYTPAATVLDSGGWKTSTTKARINEYTPVRIWQTRGIWYATVGAPTWEEMQRTRVLFQDGMKYTRGRLVGGGSLTVSAKVEKVKRTLDKQVSRYIAGFCQSVEAARKLEPPSNGDCWGCLMKAAGMPASFEVMGYDHYLSHFEEPYYVPSLAWRAVQDRGNPAFCYQLMMGRAEQGDTSMLRSVLQSWFRKIKPRLLEEVQKRGAR